MALLILLLHPGPSAAQTSGHPETLPPDSVYAEGYRLGVEAAKETSGRAGYLLGGFLSGVPTGLFGFCSLAGGGECLLPALGGMGGLVVTGGILANRARNLPLSLQTRLEGSHPSFLEGVERGYFDQYRRRHVPFALWGGIIGTGVGAGLLILVVAQAVG